MKRRTFWLALTLTSGVAANWLLACSASTTPVGPASASSAPAAPPPSAAAATRFRVPVTSADLTLGKSDAPITIIFLFSYESEACASVQAILDRALLQHGDQLRVILKHLPSQFMAAGRLPHVAALAAQAQGKFPAFHARLISQVEPWDRSRLLRVAAELGLDLNRFTKDLEDGAAQPTIASHEMMAKRLALGAAPAVLINGRLLPGPYDDAALASAIRGAQAETAGRLAKQVPAAELYEAITRDGRTSAVEGEEENRRRFEVRVAADDPSMAGRAR